MVLAVKCRYCSSTTPKSEMHCRVCKSLLEGAVITINDPSIESGEARGYASASIEQGEKSVVSLWSKIKSAHRTVVDNVGIQMLQQNYTALVNQGMSQAPDRAAETTAKFVAIANEIRPQFSNWSEDGFLQMAKIISNEAAKDQHLNKSSAVAKGLVSVWIECHARSHVVAELIKVDLDNLIAANTALQSPAINKISTPSEDLAGILTGYFRPDVQADDIDYGYESDNPILCKDIPSSKLYLSSLRHEGRRVNCERIGSVVGPGNRILDHYSVSDSEGEISELYVDAHAGEAASTKIPFGFTFSKVS